SSSPRPTLLPTRFPYTTLFRSRPRVEKMCASGTPITFEAIRVNDQLIRPSSRRPPGAMRGLAGSGTARSSVRLVGREPGVFITGNVESFREPLAGPPVDHRLREHPHRQQRGHPPG